MLSNIIQCLCVLSMSAREDAPGKHLRGWVLDEFLLSKEEYLQKRFGVDIIKSIP